MQETAYQSDRSLVLKDSIMPSGKPDLIYLK